MNLLTIKNLDFSYNNKGKTLKNINLSINDGIVALLGPNGAGKTTLMKILATITNTNKDEIHFNDISYSDTETMRKYIGYLPQKFETYTRVTGREFLNFIYDVRGLELDKRKHIEEIIEMVDLKDFVDKKIKTYSGGVLRRLGIAQALVGNPKFIIIDEPTVGLDPEQRILFRNLLSTISEERIVLISTHIVEDIEFCSNNLIIINNGEILYNGEAQNLIERYSKKIFFKEVTRSEYEEMKKTFNILDFKIEGSKYIVKYLDKEKEGNSTNISLEDAYICCINGY
ncbi:MAG: ATP-binding cassette domain-containing protein [Sarcina sp.]